MFPYNSVQGTKNWLQGSKPNLQPTKTAAQIQPAATAQYFQPTVSAAINQRPAPNQNVYVAPRVTSGTGTNTGVRTTSTAPAPYVPSAAEVAAAAAAAKAAEDAAKLAKAKGEVNPLLDKYNSMFGGLYGRINTAAADQMAMTRGNYGEQRNSLTNDYNQQVPQIDMSYYLSGVGDSSLRLRGQGQAETAFTNSLGQVKKNEEADLTQIGQSRATTEARYKADQAGIEDIRKQISESTNPDEILTLRNNLQTKIRGLEADMANFDTAEGFRGSLAKAAPVKDLAPIQNTLKTLMSGAAHPALKKQIAEQIIGGAGLNEDQKNDLFNQYLKG